MGGIFSSRSERVSLLAWTYLPRLCHLISLRTEKGCWRCNFYQSMEDENELCVLEEWDTRENLNRHMKSERFKVLRGATYLLQEPHETVFHTVAAG